MKKFLSVLMVAVLALTLSVAAFAADNSVVGVENVAGVSEIVAPVEGAEVKGASDSMTETEMATQAQADVPNSSQNKISKMTVVATFDLTVPANTVIPEKGLEFTFKLDQKLATNEMAFIYHCKTDGSWECVGMAYPGADEITGTFKSLSPVQIVKGVLNAGGSSSGSSSSSASTGATSPNTGVDSVIVYAMIAILMSGAVIFATRKKEA